MSETIQKMDNAKSSHNNPLHDRVENIVGKGGSAHEQFLLFPQCFQKLSVVDASKWISME